VVFQILLNRIDIKWLAIYIIAKRTKKPTELVSFSFYFVSGFDNNCFQLINIIQQINMNRLVSIGYLKRIELMSLFMSVCNTILKTFISGLNTVLVIMVVDIVVVGDRIMFAVFLFWIRKCCCLVVYLLVLLCCICIFIFYNLVGGLLISFRNIKWLFFCLSN